ncbi:hypothetical protein L2E82_12473 [Cichorium intybus]|uniref:Uncharacterized protein n=1 Tax=Cichorium intybus TaxID=13427 RepID=A0ACB9GHF1_CICIN|nr:hypothetical protein L2E82_12473 [Cichorium intybus]
MSDFFESVGSFFSGRVQRQLPSTTVEFTRPDSEIDANDAYEVAMMSWCWAMVYSYPVDVERGIVKLQESMPNTNNPLQKRKKLYLLGVGYYRSGKLSRSRQLLEQCLEIDPPPIWSHGVTLKKTVEDPIAKYRVIEIGLTATALGLIVGGIAAALVRRNY